MSALTLLKSALHPYRWLNYMFKHKHWYPDEMWNSRFTFSQFGEDIILENLFEGVENGFYVDIGAFDPIRLSNTYFFYRKGWRGICVEPNPEGFGALEERRPRDIHLNQVVGLHSESLAFHLDGETSRLLLEGEETSDSNTIKVQSEPLQAVLERHLPSETKIQFLSVDCEGHDLNVLQSNDWANPCFRPEAVVVEGLKPHRSALVEFMNSVDYYYYCRVGLSMVFVDSSLIAKVSFDTEGTQL